MQLLVLVQIFRVFFCVLPSSESNMAQRRPWDPKFGSHGRPSASALALTARWSRLWI